MSTSSIRVRRAPVVLVSLILLTLPLPCCMPAYYQIKTHPIPIMPNAEASQKYMKGFAKEKPAWLTRGTGLFGGIVYGVGQSDASKTDNISSAGMQAITRARDNLQPILKTEIKKRLDSNPIEGQDPQEVTQKLLYWFDRFIVEGDDIWISEQGTCYGLVSMPAARLDHFVAMLRECSDCDEWDEQNAFDKELTAAREQKHKRDEAFRKRQAAEEQASRSKPAGQGDQGGGTGGVAAPKPPPAAPAKKFILAVFDIQAKRLKANRSFVDELTDYLAMRLASTGHFEVVPRAALKKRLLESKKSSYRQCFDESCQIELGRELAAEKTLATEILRLGSKCKVTMALYDLKKATADHASTVDGACDEDGLTRSLDKAVEELTRT